MKISELSKRTGVSLRSLRYYEKQGILNPNRLENGYREYCEDDVIWVNTIQVLINIGTSTEEIANFLQCQLKIENRLLDSKLVTEFYEEKLLKIENQLQELQKAKIILEDRLEHWKREVYTIEDDQSKPENDNTWKSVLQNELRNWIKD
ncbi:MerR family transcriptional regulator [Clostridium sp. AL.422]|uniref:MerR family transcriptional regulator n=1 Tax=Clostridium TaxID=1485 RepID=UPI00293DF158|nr:MULTISPECIES: MerR family transcriptional regulator [unclassified Clostridium]MDV4149305.1 MerR family transcriptional regulator [Clostridium sp. AL.422]